MNKKYFILIVSTHRLIAEGMAKILMEHDVISVQNYGEAIDMLSKWQFDYALVDFELGSSLSGLRLVKPLLNAKVKPIMVGGEVGIGKIRASIKIGAFGYVDTRKSAESTISLLTDIENNKNGYPADIVKDMHFNHDYQLPPLRKTEKLVLDCLYNNPTFTNLQIGEAVSKSEGRVRNCLTALMRKFGVKQRQNLWREIDLCGYFPEDDTALNS